MAYAPIKVKTRDWGPNFKDVSDHIRAKAAATLNHSTELAQEISTHAGHAYSRHGYQAGWVEQVVRCVTHITPDQAFSPTGVEAVIRQWNARFVGSPDGSFTQIVTTYDASGEPVVGAPGSGFSPTGHTTSAGDESGGFLSPELQQRALAKATTIANNIKTLAEVQFPGIKKEWKPLDKIMIVVDAQPSLGFGLGFRRTGNTSFTRPQILDLVQAMHEGKTWGEVDPVTYPPLDASDMQMVLYNPIMAKSQQSAQTVRAKRDQVAFPGVGPLLDYLQVEAFWQKAALVILRKELAGWKRVTMYPCNLADPGRWAPATKVAGHSWSGKARRPDVGKKFIEQVFPVPSWSPR